MACKHFCRAVLPDEQHIVFFGLGALLHTRTTHWHSRDRQADGIGLLIHKAFDVGAGNMPFDKVAVDLGRVTAASLSEMPASFLTRSSSEGSAAFTFTSNPLASRCLTQLPQHSHVVDFQTSMVGLAAKAGEPNRDPHRKRGSAPFYVQ
jgi:hypothetical protein